MNDKKKFEALFGNCHVKPAMQERIYAVWSSDKYYESQQHIWDAKFTNYQAAKPRLLGSRKI